MPVRDTLHLVRDAGEAGGGGGGGGDEGSERSERSNIKRGGKTLGKGGKKEGGSGVGGKAKDQVGGELGGERGGEGGRPKSAQTFRFPQSTVDERQCAQAWLFIDAKLRLALQDYFGEHDMAAAVL